MENKIRIIENTLPKQGRIDLEIIGVDSGVLVLSRGGNKRYAISQEIISDTISELFKDASEEVFKKIRSLENGSVLGLTILLVEQNSNSQPEEIELQQLSLEELLTAVNSLGEKSQRRFGYRENLRKEDVIAYLRQNGAIKVVNQVTIPGSIKEKKDNRAVVEDNQEPSRNRLREELNKNNKISS